MSVEQARQLIDRAATDPEFRARVDAAAESERRDVLIAEGYGDVRREHVEQVGQELSNDEAHVVTGGVSGGFARPDAMETPPIEVPVASRSSLPDNDALIWLKGLF